MNDTTAYQQALQAIEHAQQNNLTRLVLMPSSAKKNINPEWLKEHNFTSAELIWLAEPLTQLPPEIGGVMSLKLLSLGDNKLSDLPSTITQLINLQYLSLRSNQLSQFPPEIGLLTKLTQLYLRSNQLTALPPEIGLLTKLTQLYLRYNQLTALPPEIGLLTKLQSLDLSSNQLTALPPEIVQLTQLTQLDLSSNQLTALPPEIGLLTQLTQLDLRSNQLTALPPEIGLLTKLTQLDLSYNQLTALPPEIGLLTQLTQLDLSSNQLTALPPEIVQLTQLTQLDLRSNQLTALPPEIGLLTKLTQLYLRSNQLTALPPEIGLLTQLTQLYLSSNQLTALPPEIGLLTKLQSLSLWGNQLTAFPPEIVQLTQLQKLDLRQNRLTTLPPQLRHLHQLTHLALHNNPMLNLPTELLGSEPRWLSDPSWLPNATDLLEFYFEATIPLNEVKIVLVGNGDVGKTTLVRTFMGDTSPNTPPPPTWGVNIDPWTLSTARGEVKANVWDFGGQDIMQPTHRFFMTERTLYLVLWDARNGQKGQGQLTHWLELVRASAPVAPILVVQNQIDVWAGEYLNQSSLHEQYQIAGFARISARYPEKYSAELADLMKQIHRQIEQLPQVWAKLPPREWAIKEALLKKAQNYLTLEGYSQCCQEHGLTYFPRQARLLKLLHDLGTVLHFDEDALKNIGVLNPEWVTQGVYQLITHQDRMGEQTQKGELTIEQVSTILNSPDYPLERHGFIIEMMRKFQLLFDFEGYTHRKFLIPNLLQTEAISFNEAFKTASERLIFEYEYAFLPDSIMPRFIVRVHSYIDAQQYWRYGVVLRQNQTRALVEAGTKSIRLTVIPPTHNPTAGQRFLRYLRDQFEGVPNELEGIHNSFEGLEKRLKRIVVSLDYPGVKISYDQLYDKFQRGKSELDQWDEEAKKNVEINVTSVFTQIEEVDYDTLQRVREKAAYEGYERWVKHAANKTHPTKGYRDLFAEGQKHYQERNYTAARIALAASHESLQKLRGMRPSELEQRQLSQESVNLYTTLVSANIADEQWVKAFEYTAAAKGRAFVKKLATQSDVVSQILTTDSPFAEILRQARDFQAQIQAETNPYTQRALELKENQCWQELYRISPTLAATMSVPELTFTQAQALAQRLNATLVEFYGYTAPHPYPLPGGEHPHPYPLPGGEHPHPYPLPGGEHPHPFPLPGGEHPHPYPLPKGEGVKLFPPRPMGEGAGGEGHFCAFVITPNASTVQYVPLPHLTPDLLAYLTLWRNQLNHPSKRCIALHDEIIKHLTHLHRVLITPLQLTTPQVILAPFAELHLLPLMAARNPATGQYLIQEHVVSFVPSLTALAVLDPTPGADLKRLLSVAYPGEANTPNYLSHVIPEAQAITEFLQTHLQLEVTALHAEQALTDEVLAQAQDYQLIHFGCHGSFNADHPADSGLLLKDRRLTLSDIISRLNLRQTHLTTLAACLTGQAALHAGEEHVGLIQAMFTAGSKAVVASLWSVDDAATRALFEHFYSHPALLTSPAQAMQTAIQQLLPHRPHPYYWAAFQVNGGSPYHPKPSALPLTMPYNQPSQVRGDAMSSPNLLELAEGLLETLSTPLIRAEVLPLLQQQPLEFPQSRVTTPEEVAQALILWVQSIPDLKARFANFDLNTLSLEPSPRIDPTIRQATNSPLPVGEIIDNDIHEVRDACLEILQPVSPSPNSPAPSLLTRLLQKLGKKG